MRKCILFIILAIFSATSVLAQSESILVSTEWLSQHINDEGLVILHVAGGRRDYTAGHIPGARYLWPGWVVQSNPDLAYQMLPVSAIDTTLEALGISNNSRIVLSGVNGNVSPVARMFLTLEYMGLGGQISILDGGFDAWKAEGKPVSTETPVVKRSSFTPKVKNSVIVNAEEVNASISKDNITIVDARAPGFYDGTTPNGMARSGHIPSAINLYFANMVDSTNRMLPKEKLKEMFSKAGVKENSSIVTYCHIGQTASMVYFTAKYLGYNASLYDGSFDEWSGRTDLPVVLPEKKNAQK